MLSQTPAGSVLLVNHSVDAQLLAKDVVTRAGFLAHTASNAFEALFQLGAARIDAIVCEKELPGRNSQWLGERVNQLYPGTPFIVSPAGTGLEWERALAQLWALRGDAAPVAEEAKVEASPAGPAMSPAATPIDDPLAQTVPDVEIVTAVDADIEAIVSAGPAPVPQPEPDGNGDERRRARRYRPKSKLPVKLRGGREGVLHDVSVGGALIETDAHVGPHRVVEIRLGDGSDVLKTMGQVVRCDVVAVRLNGIVYRVGVAFKSQLSESEIQKLVGGDGA